MDRKTLAIGVLSVTAVVLFVAQFLPVQKAEAAFSIRDRDYSVVTARVQQGGEGLYVVDNRSGLIAVYTWDATARTVRLRAIRPLGDAFSGGANGK